MRKTRLAMLAAAGAAAVTAAIAVPLLALGSPPGPAQPPSAGRVAAITGASAFTDCGPAPAAGVADSGVAVLDGEPVGIDAFATPEALHSWGRMALGFGVEPLRVGATWVVYRALEGGKC